MRAARCNHARPSVVFVLSTQASAIFNAARAAPSSSASRWYAANARSSAATLSFGWAVHHAAAASASRSAPDSSPSASAATNASYATTHSC
jgi:hypothetical protein